MEECIKHGILKDILPKEKGVIEDMITVCYDEEIHKMREAEYNQELGEERGKEIGKLQPEREYPKVCVNLQTDVR